MPYEAHPAFRLPEDKAAPIWRYMNFTKFVALLDTGSLYFTRADKLVEIDPYEGSLSHVNAVWDKVTWEMLPEEIWHARGFKTKSDLEHHKKVIRIVRRVRGNEDAYLNFINCWHEGYIESDAMWKIYAPGSEGIAVRSTVDRFITSIKDNNERVFFGRVRYIDYNKDPIDEFMVFDRFISKRLSFKHEHELRAVIWRPLDTEEAYAYADGRAATKEHHDISFIKNMYPDRLGLPLALDLNRLIEKIYISPTAPGWFTDLVKSIVKKLDYNFEIGQSDLGLPPPPIV